MEDIRQFRHRESLWRFRIIFDVSYVFSGLPIEVMIGAWSVQASLGKCSFYLTETMNTEIVSCAG